MKSFAAVSFVITPAITAPTFSRINTDDKADCEKANGTWDWIKTKCLASVDLSRVTAEFRRSRRAEKLWR
jgi:hypothetical protein